MHSLLKRVALADDFRQPGLVVRPKCIGGEPLHGIEPSVDGECGETAIVAVQDFLAGELAFERGIVGGSGWSFHGVFGVECLCDAS